MAIASKKSVNIDREQKIIIRNDNAVVVLVNGKPIVIKAIRVAIPDQAGRDLEFMNLVDFRIFVDNCREVLLATEAESATKGELPRCS